MPDKRRSDNSDTENGVLAEFRKERENNIPTDREAAAEAKAMEDVQGKVQRLVALSQQMEEHKQKTVYKLFKCFNPIRKTAEYKEFKSIIRELESRKPYSECSELSVRKYSYNTVFKGVSNLSDLTNKVEKRYIEAALSKERTKILGGVFGK
jgi:hypothetical protein